jgi:hypothetical protein
MSDMEIYEHDYQEMAMAFHELERERLSKSRSPLGQEEKRIT